MSDLSREIHTSQIMTGKGTTENLIRLEFALPVTSFTVNIQTLSLSSIPPEKSSQFHFNQFWLMKANGHSCRYTQQRKVTKIIT